GERDQHQARRQRQGIAEDEIDHHDRGRLAADGKPAEPNQRVEPKRAGPSRGDGKEIGHGRAWQGFPTFAICALDPITSGRLSALATPDFSAGTMTPPVRGFAVEVAGLAKVYKGVTAVDRVSFSIEVGSITGLLGGNGAGKTTTIGMILGLILPTAGTIR